MRTIYNIAQCAGVEAASGTISQDTVDEDIELVKAWVDENFSDFIETEIPSTGYLVMHLKGNDVFLAIRLSTTASGSTAYNYYNIGTSYGDGSIAIKNSRLTDQNIKLLVEKSKHGVLLNMYTDMNTQSGMLQILAVNMGTYFLPIILVADTFYIINDSTQLSFAALPRGASGDVCLSRINMPYREEIPENVYLSSGIAVTRNAEYTVNGQKFAEMYNSTYSTFALKVEDYEDGDFAGIT